MSAVVSQTRRRLSLPTGRSALFRLGVVLVILIAIVTGTKVVGKNSALSAGPVAFSPSAFGAANFGKVQQAIAQKAAPAATLAAALKSDQADAVKKYGVDLSGAPGPELCVSVTGTVTGTAQDGIYTISVPQLPKTLVIRVQTGPAINGTDLRDASGLFSFGQFTNQIDFQNAASALNDQLKQTVLAKLDTASLSGKGVTLVGAFQLINPNGWLITPTKLELS